MIPQLQRDIPVSSAAITPSWSAARKIGFRFAFSYFFLYISPGPIGSLSPYKPIEAVSLNIFVAFWHQVVPWVGVNLLHLNAGMLNEVPNGSGDELYDYVLWFCIALGAVIVTAVWSVLDRKRPNYRTLDQWLRLMMRMTVGWSMLGYGVKKLVGAQFPPPLLSRLRETYAQASPTGLLWTFMGASQAYSFFGGFGETLGGALILVPMLTTLGTLISALMLTNVLMLNLCYDVPRKIFTINLLLMCGFLLLPELERLTNVFVLNRRAEPVVQPKLFKDKLLNMGVVALQLGFGAYVLLVAGKQSIEDRRDMVAKVPPAYLGIWSVAQFNRDGILHPPLLTDNERWQDVIFDWPKQLIIESMDGKQKGYYMQLDAANHRASLWDIEHPSWRALLNVTDLQANRMTLEGKFGDHQINAVLNRVDLNDPVQFSLTNRGFHWVNPYVNNH